MLGRNVAGILKMSRDENGQIDLSPLVSEIADKVIPVWKRVRDNVEDRNLAIGTYTSAMMMALCHFAVSKGVSLDTLKVMLDRYYEMTVASKRQGMN